MRFGDSDAGWSDPGDEVAGADRDDDDDEHPFATAEQARYRKHDLVGSGGMGQVHSAWDRRLGREVAIKTIACDVDAPATAARLAREAWITGRLEHPGIVPVYDAGRGPDGRLFYSMRFIRGRSFADVMAATVDLEGRLALVRDYLAACHAVAYAHGQGVVHRDLKPANFMVGEFGETLVVDWGLAIRLAGDDGPMLDGDGEPRAAGTPAYMSPEQAAARPTGRESDVWSLGAVLYELLVGRQLMPVATTRDAAAQLARGLDLSALRAPGLPGELAAVAEKALAPSVADRYPDAGALSADVAAFLDGRRVAAHDYSSVELLRRLVRAWRVPIVVGVAGLVIALLVFGFTWRRVVGERERALAAEVHVRDALAEQRLTLGRALVGWAINAHEAGASPEAELIAAHALTMVDAPEARGILSAAYASARPTFAERDPPPDCARVLAASSTAWLCMSDGKLRFSEIGAARPRWELAGDLAEAALLGDDTVAALRSARGLLLLDARDGSVVVEFAAAEPAKGLHVSHDRRRVAAQATSGDVVIVDAPERRVRRVVRVCDGSPLSAFALGRESVIAACADGRVVRRGLDDGALLDEHEVPYAPPSKGVIAVAVHDDDRRVVVGGVDGTVVLVDLVADTQTAPLQAVEGPAAALSFVGDRVLVTPDRGASAIWDLGAAKHVMHLPAGAQVFVRSPGVLVGLGRAIWLWHLPALLPPWRFVASAGLSHATISPDGELLAVAGGDGAVTVWSRRDGLTRARLEIGTGVIKRVAFSADGKRLAAAVAGSAGVRVFDTSTWAPLPYDAGRPSRRLLFLADGTLIALPYGDDLDVWTPDGRVQRTPGPRARDAAVAESGDRLWLLTEDERVVVWRDGKIEHVVDAPGATALAIGAHDQLIATVQASGIRLHDRARNITSVLARRSGEPLDVQITPDGQWVIAGTLSGTSDVWSASDGRYVAALRGHRERNSPGVVAPDGQLVTTSWDGTVRAWNLSVLTTPPPQLIRDAEAAWRLSLDDVLDEAPGAAAVLGGAQSP